MNGSLTTSSSCKSSGDDIDKTRATWNSENTKHLLTAVIAEITKYPTRIEKGLKCAQWTRIHEEFVESSKCNYEKSKLISRLSDLRKKWTIFKALTVHVDFEWNEINRSLSAPDEVWNEVIEKLPGAKEFRFKILDNFDLLDQIFAVYTGQQSCLTLSILNSSHDDSESLDPISLLQSCADKRASIDDDSEFSVSEGNKRLKNDSVLDKLVEAIENFHVHLKNSNSPLDTSALTKALNLFDKNFKNKYPSANDRLKCKQHLASSQLEAELFLSLDGDERDYYIQQVVNKTV